MIFVFLSILKKLEYRRHHFAGRRSGIVRRPGDPKMHDYTLTLQKPQGKQHGKIDFILRIHYLRFSEMDAS